MVTKNLAVELGRRPPTGYNWHISSSQNQQIAHGRRDLERRVKLQWDLVNLRRGSRDSLRFRLSNFLIQAHFARYIATRGAGCKCTEGDGPSPSHTSNSTERLRCLWNQVAPRPAVALDTLSHSHNTQLSCDPRELCQLEHGEHSSGYFRYVWTHCC
jgi:hypothetical protein